MSETDQVYHDDDDGDDDNDDDDDVDDNDDYDDDDELTATFPPSQQGARVFAAGKAALAANTTCMRGSNIKILQYRNI